MYKEKLNEYSKNVKNSFDKVDDLRVENIFKISLWMLKKY